MMSRAKKIEWQHFHNLNNGYVASGRNCFNGKFVIRYEVTLTPRNGQISEMTDFVNDSIISKKLNPEMISISSHQVALSTFTTFFVRSVELSNETTARTLSKQILSIAEELELKYTFLYLRRSDDIVSSLTESEKYQPFIAGLSTVASIPGFFRESKGILIVSTRGINAPGPEGKTKHVNMGYHLNDSGCFTPITKEMALGEYNGRKLTRVEVAFFYPSAVERINAALQTGKDTLLTIGFGLHSTTDMLSVYIGDFYKYSGRVVLEHKPAEY
jgi:hypothetical protein